MTVDRIASVFGWILIASVAATAQQRDDSGSVSPSRHLTIRSSDGQREVVTEIIETPDLDGRFKSVLETTTETIRSTPDTMSVKRDVVRFGLQGERMLMETTRVERETLPDGTVTVIENTWTPDFDGRLRLTYRRTQTIRSIPQSIEETQPGTLRGEITPCLREETIDRLDVNGDLTLTERTVTRRSQANGHDQIVTETFARDVGGMVQSGNRLELTRRVLRTTAAGADGSVALVEEIDERVPGCPSEPIRTVRRRLGTIRQVDAERRETDVRVFDLDLNGRFVLTARETTETKGAAAVKH